MINTAYLIATIILVWIGFRIANVFGAKNQTTQRYIPLLATIELFSWTVIIFRAIHIFFSDKLYYPHLIIILVLVFTFLIVWYYVKDIVAGFLFRVRHNPKKGQQLISAKHQGPIRSIGLAQLTLEGTDGHWQRVPYSALVTEALSLEAQQTLAPGETVICVKLNPRIDPNHFGRRIRETLALSSWCIASKPITIAFDKADEGIVRISFFMLDPSYYSLANDKVIRLVNQFE